MMADDKPKTKAVKTGKTGKRGIPAVDKVQDYDFFIDEFLPLAECIIDKSINLHRPFLNTKSNFLKDLLSKVTKIEDKNITTKDIEINDKVLRQIMFLFNLEMWYQLFIENDNLKNPSLSLNSFL